MRCSTHLKRLAPQGGDAKPIQQDSGLAQSCPEVCLLSLGRMHAFEDQRERWGDYTHTLLCHIAFVTPW